jgi:hypothetical protein
MRSDSSRSAATLRKTLAQRHCTEDNKKNKFVINPSPTETHILNLLFKESSKHNLCQQFLFFSSHFAPLETINSLFIIFPPFVLVFVVSAFVLGVGREGAGNPLDSMILIREFTASTQYESAKLRSINKRELQVEVSRRASDLRA